MLATTYGLAKTGLRVTQFSIARNALLRQSSSRATQFLGGIAQSGGDMYGVRAFLGRAPNSTQTNEHVASMILVVLGRQAAWGVRDTSNFFNQITSPINTPSNKANNSIAQSTGNANDR